MTVGTGAICASPSGTEPKTRDEIEFDPERPTKIIEAPTVEAVATHPQEQ